MSRPDAMASSIDPARIRAARDLIDPVFLNTPVIAQSVLDRALCCTVFAKVETLNPIRSFKGRGTEFFAAVELRAGDHVVCGSAGNFGQGLARAAAGRGAKCTVFAPVGANPLKIEAMRQFGASVHLDGQDFDDAKLAAQRFAGATRARYVEDGAEPAIAEGAGTIGLELASQIRDLELVVIPVGNGALLSGVGAALRPAAPNTHILGVVAEQAPAMKLSLEHGCPVETMSASTIADGIAVRVPIAAALRMLQGCYDSVLAVSDDDIVHAVRLVHEALGLVVEPAGAVGIAAILRHRHRFEGRRAATILTGGNITSAQLANCLSLAKGDRFLSD